MRQGSNRPKRACVRGAAVVGTARGWQRGGGRPREGTGRLAGCLGRCPSPITVLASTLPGACASLGMLAQASCQGGETWPGPAWLARPRPLTADQGHAPARQCRLLRRRLNDKALGGEAGQHLFISGRAGGGGGGQGAQGANAPSGNVPKPAAATAVVHTAQCRLCAMLATFTCPPLPSPFASFPPARPPSPSPPPHLLECLEGPQLGGRGQLRVPMRGLEQQLQGGRSRERVSSGRAQGGVVEQGARGGGDCCTLCVCVSVCVWGGGVVVGQNPSHEPSAVQRGAGAHRTKGLCAGAACVADFLLCPAVQHPPTLRPPTHTPTQAPGRRQGAPFPLDPPPLTPHP